MRTLAFVDTETTGLDAYSRDVVDIWATVLDAATLEPLIEAGGLIAIPHERALLAERRAVEVNGYDHARWEQLGARPWGEVWGEVADVITGSAWVGHNAGFDIRFCEAMCSRYGDGWSGSRLMVIDTMSMAHHLVAARRVAGHGLTTLCLALRLDGGEHPEHSARGDVARTIALYKALIGRV